MPEKYPGATSRNAPGNRVGASLGRPSRVLLIVLAIFVVSCERTPSISEIRSLHASGDYAASIEPLRQRLDRFPDDAEAHLLYGVALNRTGDSRHAIWSLKKAGEAPELMVSAYLALSAGALSSGNWALAIESADHILDEFPDEADALIARGEAYLSEGKQPERALEDFDRVLEQRPEHWPTLASRAATLLFLGRVDDAVTAIQTLDSRADGARGQAADRARLCTTLAVIDAERGLIEESRSQFESCLERFPAHAVVLESAVSFFDQIGDHARATEILSTALEISPESQTYRSWLASRASATRDFDRAEEILRGSLTLDEPYLREVGWTELANHFLFVRDDVDAAAEAYDEAMAIATEPSQMAILMHADLLARVGKHARALDVAKQLESEAHRGLIEARIDYDQGQPRKALARLDRLLPSWPNNAGARYYAARSSEQLGDFARAIEEYRQSIRSAPEQTEAALRLAKLYLAAGAIADARQSASQYIQAHPTDPEGVRMLLRTFAGDGLPGNAAIEGRFGQSPLFGPALAARAELMAAGGRAREALQSLETNDARNGAAANHVAVLRARVALLIAVDRLADARAILDRALEESSDESIVLEAHALLLEAEGATLADVRKAYRRALEADPKNHRALEALGRLAESQGDTSQALAHYDAASLANPESATAAWHAIRIVRETEAGAALEQRLESLLREHPWNAEAALELASLRMDRGVADKQTIGLAERAILFRAGPEARSLLARIHVQRGETERAREIENALEAAKPVTPREITTFPVAPAASSSEADSQL